MKNKWLQFSQYILAFGFLGLFFFCGNYVKATTQTSIINNGPATLHYAQYGTDTQTFTAVNNNINGYSQYIYQGTYVPITNFSLCEVSSITSTTCIGGDLVSGLNSDQGQNTTAWATVNFPSPIATTIGHFYMMTMTYVGATYTVDAVYSGGTSAWYNPNSYLFQVYYDDSYTPPLPPPINNPYLDQSIFFFNNPYSCGIGSTCNIHYAYNTDLISDYDYIEIFKWSDGFGTTTSLGTTTIEESKGFLQDKANGQSHFLLTDSATTTKTIFYDVVTHLAAYYDYNTGLDVAATTTTPYEVSVIWSGQPDVNTIITGINDLAAQDLASTTILGIDAHSMACSEDQWSASSSIGIFGATGTSATFLGCVAKEGAIDFGLKIVSVMKTIIDGAMRVLSYTFPLNIPVKIQSSWTAAQHTTLPSDLSWLAIGDDDGNINIDIPPLYTGQATTTWAVWGPNLWGNTGAINTMLIHWRALTVYLLWATWILLAIYELADKVIKKHE